MRGLAVAVVGLVVAAGCAPRARMCTASADCGDKSPCIAGRCQLQSDKVKPAVDGARRLVVRPTDMAVISPFEGPSGGALPPVFALGRDATRLLLRFSVPLPPTANVIEAYVVLRRSSLVDDEPAPVSLHVIRIEEPWSAASVSWAFQPKTSETRAPSTAVQPGGEALVRMDVRDIVRHWAKHDPRDQGVAVVSENETRSGTTFALTANGADRDVEPYLELYVR